MPLRREVEAFVLAFDSNHKPIVGQQITISRPASAAALARASLLVARAEAGDCDLVAKAPRRPASAGISIRAAGSLCQTSGRGIAERVCAARRYPSLTLTCAPPGSGYRIGIDRNGDGILDGDEIR